MLDKQIGYRLGRDVVVGVQAEMGAVLCKIVTSAMPGSVLESARHSVEAELVALGVLHDDAHGVDAVGA